ncbi:MAG: VanZ family protein [Azonexus sp.]|jgi:VanZ family protein|nr:VanZ family protein [Azonexus sp.]
MSVHGRRSLVLARYLTLVWFGLIVYASLHPFSGWRDTGIHWGAFLEAAWPRYWTAFDLIANIAVYLPLGFFLTLVLAPLRWRWLAVCLAILLGSGLSLGLETLQNWLPSRIPSSLDLACNAFGSFLGAILGHLLGPRVFSRLESAAHRLLSPIPHGELGLTLLGLWLIVPLSPEILLFGAGDMRQLIGFTPAIPFSIDHFALIEASITAAHAVATGLLLRALLASAGIAYLIVPLFFIVALLIRTLGAAILISPENAMAWYTVGAQQGLLAAGALLGLMLWLPARIALLFAVLSLVAGTVLVNLAPANPYSAAALAVWQQGHFLNFNGLTRLIASLWPFLALPFFWLAVRRP